MIQRNFVRYVSAVSCLAAMMLAQAAHAEWKVDNKQSAFHFVTTKAGAAGASTVTEAHRFTEVGGTVGDDGKIDINVTTASVDTLIPLRDTRLREILFKSVSFPNANFTAQVAMDAVQKLKVGELANIDVPGTIKLLDKSQAITAKLRVIRLGGGRLLVETREPLIINANDFALQAGVETLRGLMGLNVLSPSAPVDFSIVLLQK